MYKKFIAAALVLLCSIGASVASEPASNRYENLALGLRLSKPDSWQFLSAEQNTETLERIEFATEEFKQKIVAHKKPLVMMVQNPEPHTGINPSVKVAIDSFPGLSESNTDGVLKLAAVGIKEQFADAQISPITEASIAGRGARRMTIDFTVRTTDGGAFPVTSVVWVVPDGDFYLVVGAAYLQGDQATWEQIKQVLQTIEWTTAPVVRR